MIRGKQTKIVDLDSENNVTESTRRARKKGKEKSNPQDDLVFVRDTRTNAEKGKRQGEIGESSKSKPLAKSKKRSAGETNMPSNKRSRESDSVVTVIDDTPKKPLIVDIGTDVDTPNNRSVIDISPDTPSDIQIISSTTRPVQRTTPHAFADDEELARRLQNEEYEAYQPTSYLHLLQRELEMDSYQDFATDIPTNNYIPDDQFDDSYETLLRLGDSIGSVSTGLPKSIYESYPTIRYKDEKLEQCVVCMTDYEKKEVVMGLPCLHWFHKKCILSWFANSSKCPM
ncbi:hypothetical protein HK103_003027 [Boothiomyces macroporosus]|uniref:RING-type domain-containing protein n=1 Tax=Boothiomyces macroporosus TaxID=261099 RepID=A0AAD5U927_9FUNG|nr:hypothetical protein HK103_003027 [Boothiomyces macroporosus]